MKGAWQVGLLVVVFGALLVSAYMVLGKQFFAPKTDRYYVELPDAGGVTKGASVLMAGVKIGKVGEVSLANSKLARLELDVDEGHEIPSGSTVSLPTALIGFGESPVRIVPPAEPGPALAPGSTLVGSKASPLDSFMPEAKGTLAELEATLVATREMIVDLRKVVNDQQVVGGVEKLLATSERTVGDFGQLAKRIDQLVAANQAKLGDALSSANLAMSDIRESTKLVTQLLKDGQLTDKTLALLDNLNTTTEKATELVTSLDKFVNDPELRGPLNKTAKNVETITDSGTRIAADAELMAKKGVEITDNVNELSKKANDLADDARGVLQQLQKVIGRTPNTGNLNLQANLDLIYESSPRHYRTDIEASMNVGPNRLRAGIYDAFETNKFTLQVGQPFGNSGEIRYGIYASKPGVGVEYEIVRGLALRGDLYDINNPRADLRARFELGGGFYGWIGAQQLFKRNSFLIGVGFRR
jgi:phospholipid/cholesterol/gamma-HCH transport system substrate-binding protein